MGPRAHIMFSNEVAAPKRLGTTEIEEAKASEFRFQLFTFFSRNKRYFHQHVQTSFTQKLQHEKSES